MSGKGLIVVGVDGSEPARIALDFALEEAAQRAGRVLVVTAVQPPEYWALNSGVIVAPSNDQLERLVEAAGRATRVTVAEAVRDAGSTAAAVPVESWSSGAIRRRFSSTRPPVQICSWWGTAAAGRLPAPAWAR